MSKKYPECPVYNHANCRDVDNPKVCALVRKDKTCLRELQKTRGQEETKKSDLPAPREPSPIGQAPLD